MDTLSNNIEFLTNTLRENKEERLIRLTELADTIYQAKALLKQGKNDEAEKAMEMAIENCEKILLIS